MKAIHHHFGSQIQVLCKGCVPEIGDNQTVFGFTGRANSAGDISGRGNCRAGILPLVLLAFGLVLLCHCSRSAQDDEYLIHVGNGSVTVSEFKQAVQSAAEEVFPGDEEVNIPAQTDLRVRVLNQLTEELMIKERARELAISVNDEELQRAVTEIKADYPDDTFEKTLLENAVSFQAWKKKLATRLLIDKVVERELVDKVEITSQDMADYFQDHYPDGVPEGQNAGEINQKIVRHLRRQKAEEMYQAWIENLRKNYPVQINQKRWNLLSKSKSWQ